MERILKALGGELTYEELVSIREEHIPKGDFYHYEKLRSVMLRKLAGEIDDKYFRVWLVVACWALNCEKYSELSWAFDGAGFNNVFPRSEVLFLLALLKDFDYQLRHPKHLHQHRKDKLQVIYLRFEHCNQTAHSDVYKAYFVDYARRRFDIRLVDSASFEFEDRLLYCFIGADDEPETEGEHRREAPRYCWEENRLVEYFYNSSEKWTYDHSLSF